MLAKTTIATVSLVALLALTNVAVAQNHGGLKLTCSAPLGVPEVWSVVAPGDSVLLTVNQDRLGGKPRPIKLYLFASTVEVLGELNPKTTQMLAKTRINDGSDYSLKFKVPADLNNTAWSVQAMALFDDGTFATSYVLTIIVDQEQANQGQPSAPGGESNNETDPAAIEE